MYVGDFHTKQKCFVGGKLVHLFSLASLLKNDSMVNDEIFFVKCKSELTLAENAVVHLITSSNKFCYESVRGTHIEVREE